MEIRDVPFGDLPVHDTCWSLIAGPDGKAYASACCEFTGGVGAFVVRVDPETGRAEPLIDVAEAVGQPADNGRATQCKIHYSLIADDDGMLYGATHVSGPPAGDLIYSPWAAWADPRRAFAGAQLFAWDLNRDRLAWTDELIPHEGCRAMALDRRRRRLYAVGYPRDHFYDYDLTTRTRRDLGRIGSVNPQAVFLDRRNRAYTTDDWGRILRYDPDAGELETLDVCLPHAPYQNGWHNVLYDVVACPDGESVVGVTWNTDPHLFRYWPEEGGHGRIADLGPALGNRTGREENDINHDHAGGLVFGGDGALYYFAQIEPHTKTMDRKRFTSEIVKLDLETGERAVLGRLADGDVTMPYVSRAVRIGRHLVLGLCCRGNMGVGLVTLEGPGRTDTAMRYWG